jgi:hypothetical protein
MLTFFYIQAVLSHPWLHGIGASMHVDEWYVVITWPFLGILAFTALIRLCMSM